MTSWSETPRKAGNVSFTGCQVDGKPFVLKLTDVSIPFEPSGWQGDGTELRKSICFSGVSNEALQPIRAMEETIGATTSCVKDGMLRCKLSTDRVKSWDATCKRIEVPKLWRGWHANVAVHVRGKWVTRQGSGLSLEVADVQFIEAEEPCCPFS